MIERSVFQICNVILGSGMLLVGAKAISGTLECGMVLQHQMRDARQVVSDA